jgi:glycerophosphoryl diester phosphodiesterase
LLVAHRGASGLAPENTRAAFLLALEMGVDGIELDIHRTRDGQFVVSHDSSVDRTTEAKGRIGAMQWARLRELDAGSWFNRVHPERARPEFCGERIPTLEEVIEFAGRKTRLYIEIKDPDLYSESLETDLLAILRRRRMESRVTLLSFSRRSLLKIRSLDPSIHTGLLLSRRSGDPCRAALSLGANGLAMLHKRVDPAFAGKVRKAGLELSVWTVDEPEEMRRMLELGADAIITNHPERILSIL